MSKVRLTPAEKALATADTAFRARDFQAAVAAYADARRLGASLKLGARGHALALSELGRHDDAVEAFKPWYAKASKDVGTINLMGVLLKRAGRLAKAAEVLETGRKLRPQDQAVLHNLGNVHELLGDHAQSAACYEAELRIAPQSAELWRLLARQQVALGQIEAAIASLRRGMALAPGDTQVSSLLALTLQRNGQVSEARDLIRRLRLAAPDDPEYAVMEARLSARMGEAVQGIEILKAMLELHPGHPNASLLAASLLGDGDLRTASAILERAVELNPDRPELLERLIEVLQRCRFDSEAAHIERSYVLAKRYMEKFPNRILEAARALRTVMTRVLDEDRMAQTGRPDVLLPMWQRNAALSAVHYELGQVSTLEDRLRLVDWHRAWGKRASAGIVPVNLPPLPALQTGRKLRIGFMSSDLRQHPVTMFALPLLEGYDRDQVEVFCYSFYEKAADSMQQHIAGQVTAFRNWPKRPDDQVAEGIAADGLDILFELGGSTAMNKLEVMAYRPARLGASWLGYPHSAGLEQIDLILTDPYLRPDDPRLLIEHAFEMPATWVALSRMFARHEIAEGTPQARKGHLTFGTANNPYKYTPACVDAWAAVLRAVPGSRFVFLRPEGGVESFVTNARAAFARRDVDPARLEFIGVRGDHMRHYNEIDIALDSLPHVGGTTTCESLWMGVPTVSLVGPGFPERLSYSNLSNAGLGDLAVFSVDDYVAKAAELAADPARRLALRHGLRAQIAAHPLGQPERFTADFYALARKVASE
ncbi:tetratricopeptide repeat protein [Pseudogemmobacter blasticus]|nr:tetratricopeptide repeat protein [Fuscovulum blasticum]